MSHMLTTAIWPSANAACHPGGSLASATGRASKATTGLFACTWTLAGGEKGC